MGGSDRGGDGHSRRGLTSRWWSANELGYRDLDPLGDRAGERRRSPVAESAFGRVVHGLAGPGLARPPSDVQSVDDELSREVFRIECPRLAPNSPARRINMPASSSSRILAADGERSDLDSCESVALSAGSTRVIATSRSGRTRRGRLRRSVGRTPAARPCARRRGSRRRSQRRSAC